MLLAVDPGTASYGWAVLDHRARVHALGAAVLEATPAEAKHRTRSLCRRLRVQVAARFELGADLPATSAITALAVESLVISVKGVMATVAAALARGALESLSVSLAMPLHDVAPATWQRAILPGTARKVDQAKLAKRLRAHLDRVATPEAQAQLDALAPDAVEHALDAVGIGTYAVLRLRALDPQQLQVRRLTKEGDWTR